MDVATYPGINQQLERFARACQADGITLWRVDGMEMVAAANPLESDMIGKRQSIQSGLISQVFLTGQGILEHDPGKNDRHDRTIDQQTGRRCTAIMAVPLQGAPWAGGEGVISVVQTQDGCGAGGFSIDDLHRLTGLAARLCDGLGEGGS